MHSATAGGFAADWVGEKGSSLLVVSTSCTQTTNDFPSPDRHRASLLVLESMRRLSNMENSGLLNYCPFLPGHPSYELIMSAGS